MPITFFNGQYSPSLVSGHPDKIFVFGDNLRGIGKGGQAIIRDNPNAFGVPTKRKPSMDRTAFFNGDDNVGRRTIEASFQRLEVLLRQGKVVVIPTTPEGDVSLGLGLASLNQRAPVLYQLICDRVEELRTRYGSEEGCIG